MLKRVWKRKKTIYTASMPLTSIINLKEMITNFRVENIKSKQRQQKYEVLFIISKTVDTFVIMATTFNSVTPSVTGFGLMVTLI